MRTILIITSILFFQQNSFAQTSTKFFLKDNLQFNFAILTEPFNTSIGTMHHISLKVFNSKHVESTIGVAHQHQVTFKSIYETSVKELITTTDAGFYLTTDCKFYPLKKKTLFATIGLFWGVTQSTTEGTVELPQYNISEYYYKRHTYMNYGSMQQIGWCFGERIQLSLYSMISLKGLLDGGRSRLAEVDSRFLVGVNLGFTIKAFHKK